MKANILPTRLILFVSNVVDGWARGVKRIESPRPGKQGSKARLARRQRKDFSCYILIMDAESKAVVGHLADLSSGGFKIDTQKPVPVNQDFRLLMHLPAEVATKPFMVFGARRGHLLGMTTPFIFL